MADIQEIEANGTVYEIAVKSTSKVSGLSTALSNINDSISGVSDNVDAVSGRVDTNEQDISDLTARVNNLQSIGRFLAMWDADTGIARYLESGFVYEQGDYFIIAQVGDPNYMPTGSSYTGASTTETEDPIEVSDMFFYDGTRWIYLPNHQRQIAVDETLSTTSTNPVENRVVTTALNNKQDTLTEDNAGEGISIVDGVISNTQTSAEWGKITGNLNDQLDLKRALDNVSGGGVNGSITWLDTRNVTMWDGGDSGYSDSNYDHDKQFKGDYADIIFQLSGGKDYLIENKDNINICINRFSRCKHNHQQARNIRKYRIITDNRIKTDFTMYCYKVVNPDSESFEYDETQNRYFYTTGHYEDMGQLINDDPAIYLYRGIGNVWSGTNNLSGWASSLDNLCDPGLNVTDITDDPGYIMRCPEHDINEINQTKLLKETNAFTRMRCREYVVDGKTYYYYSMNWRTLANIEDTEDVFVACKYNEEGDEVPLEKFVYEPGRETDDMGIGYINLGKVGEIIDPHTPFVRHPEFDWYWWAFDSEQDMMNAIIETSEARKERDTTPNAYLGDYPVKPVRLADCSYLNTKNRIIKHEEGTEEEWEEILVYAGQYLSFKWTLFEHPEWIQDEEELTFRLPYDTYHLNMRFQGFQKSAMDQNLDAKNNIMRAMETSTTPTKWGAEKGSVHFNNHARLTEAIQFCTKTNDEVRFGKRSKTNIINRKLTVVLFDNMPTCKQTLL